MTNRRIILPTSPDAFFPLAQIPGTVSGRVSCKGPNIQEVKPNHPTAEEAFGNCKVLFSIDNAENQAELAAFMRDMAIKNISFVPLTGCYKGDLENAFAVNYKDFMLLDPVWMMSQETVLMVTKCNKQYATLVFLEEGEIKPGFKTQDLGSMHQIDGNEADKLNNWTYDQQQKVYFTARKGNPDRQAPADIAARELWSAIDAVIDLYGPYAPVGGALDDLKDVREAQRPLWLN